MGGSPGPGVGATGEGPGPLVTVADVVGDCLSPSRVGLVLSLAFEVSVGPEPPLDVGTVAGLVLVPTVCLLPSGTTVTNSGLSEQAFAPAF